MKVVLGIVLALVLILGGAFLFGVFEAADDGPLENAGEAIEGAGESAVDSVEGAGDTLGDAAEDAGDAIEDATD